MHTFLPMKSVVGSCKNVSSTVIRASSFCLNKPKVISQVLRKGPKPYVLAAFSVHTRPFDPKQTIIPISAKSINHIMR